MRAAALLTLTVALAFSIRVVPAWQGVFTPAGINFQDSDCWAHMRAVHNLAAHFPLRSTFDPYGAFPGGQITHQDLWDVAVAFTAWVLGVGHPSASLIDQVGAWLPAILGALFPIPIFFLGRRLFGDLAAGLGALIAAVLPGTLLWTTHLGVPDHHAAEGFLSLLVLLLLSRAALRPAVLAGLLLGLYFGVRPNGVFVPATLAIAALIQPSLAPLVGAALLVAGAVFALAGGVTADNFVYLTLTGGIAICAVAWVLDEIWRRKQWPRWFLPPTIGMAAIAAVGIIAVSRPALFAGLLHTIRDYLPGSGDLVAGTVTEAVPLWRVPPLGFTAIYQNLGGLWPVALLFLACCILKIVRERNPALVLFTVWGIVMTIGGFLQTRMGLYLGPVIAITAGAGLAWVISVVAGRAARLRVPLIAIAVAVVFAVNLPAAWRLSHLDGGIDSNWRAAFRWLSENSPEPMGDARVWYQRTMAPERGEFRYPASAYGVLTWWDYGYALNFLAHRIPNTMGGQTNAAAVGRFLAATEPDRAHLLLGKLGSRYIVVDPTVVTRNWAGIVVWAGEADVRYRRHIIAVGPNGPYPLTVYLPDYYKAMATRLYAFDGKASGARTRFSVFTTHKEKAISGKMYDILISERIFSTEQEAWNFMGVSQGEDMILGSADPTMSCVELKELPWATRVFSSDDTPLSVDRAPKAVKVFEVAR